MGNEYDYKGKHLVLQPVSRSEFEPLKRFGDYTELNDGRLMRLESEMEFRIYCEDVEGCPIGVVTAGVLNLFADLCDDAPEKQMMQASKGVTHGHVNAAELRVQCTPQFRL
jgi:hypothetical protein